MKSKAFPAIAALAVLGLISVSSVSAQCVQCKPVGGCFFCTPSMVGGCTCYTNGCNNCNIGTPCTGICDSPSLKGQRIVISDDLIRMIAAVDTDFARALISFHGRGAPADISKIYITPVEVTEAEFAWFLKKPEESKTFMRKYGKKVQRAYDLGSTPLEFDVTVSQLAESVISVNVRAASLLASGRPLSHSSITLNLQQPEKSAVETLSAKQKPAAAWQVIDWRFN